MRNATFIFLFFAAGLSVCGSFAQTFNKARMDSLMDVLAAKNKVMLSIALSQNGTLIYSRAIGYSAIDNNHKLPASTHTRYRIGSISKVFTSVMIFQLIEEGKLKLSTPLAAYFPALPNASKITMANLLHHDSGLHNFTSDSAYASMLSKKVTEDEMLNMFKVAKSDFEPGSKNQYSNTNFVLLGYIIERIDKRPYAVSLNTRILKKINLKDTYYGGNIDITRQEAQSYKWQNKWVPETETDMSIPGGAGGLVSTPDDLTRFMTALFTGKLVSDSSLHHLIEIRNGRGMDLVDYHFDNRTGFGHNGGIDGFQSQVVYYPQENLATAYTANGVNTSLNKMMQGVLSIYFNKPYTLPAYPHIQLKPGELDPFVGIYASKNEDYKIIFTQKDGQLIARFSDESGLLNLEATSHNTFIYEQYDLTFIFNSQGQVIMNEGNKTFTKEK